MTALAACGLWVVHEKGFPEREKFQKLAEVLEQLTLIPFKNQDGERYFGKEEIKKFNNALYDDQIAGETVAVIGDSHGRSAFHGLSDLGKNLGFNTAMLGWYVPGGKYWHPGWENQRTFMLDVMRTKKDITKVFIVTRGPVYLSFRHIAGERGRPFGNANDLGAGPIPANVFKADLQDMVNELRGMGKEVFIVAENPELNVDSRDLFNRGLTGVVMRESYPPTTRNETLTRQKPYLDLLAQIQGATIVHTIDAFCSSGVCRILSDEGLPLYYDDDHLSKEGGRFLAREVFYPVLKTN